MDHPRRNGSHLLGVRTPGSARSMLTKVDPSMIKGDPDKLAKRLYELANIADRTYESYAWFGRPSVVGAELD